MSIIKVNTRGTETVGGGRRNMLMNGGMTVIERGHGTTSVASLGDGNEFGVMDRWYVFSGNTAGRFTMSQDTDVPVGFRKAMKLTCTTADTSVAANEYIHLNYAIEGRDLQHLEYNTANAKTTVVSFYVKGNAAASYTFAAQYHLNGGTARWFTKEIPVTTSWVRQEIQIVGDTNTSGSYGINDDNNGRWSFHVWLHGGTNYSSGTFADGTWADRDYTKTLNNNQTSFVDSTSRTFFMTGWQFEVGERASDFEHRPYHVELLDCQRYFEIVASGGGTNKPITSQWQGTVTHQYNTTRMFGRYPYKVRKRTNPTVTVHNHSFQLASNSASGGSRTLSNNPQNTYADPDGVGLDFQNQGVSYTGGEVGHVDINTDCFITADADIT